MKYILEYVENSYYFKFSTVNNIYITNEIIISDISYSKRQLLKMSNDINNFLDSHDIIYIPIRFTFKKLGDEKHRISIFKKNNIIEVFDPNNWNYVNTYFQKNNKDTLLYILNNSKYKIYFYNLSLNTIDGYCVTFNILFLIYRYYLSRDEVNSIFKKYEKRIKINYEKYINKLIIKKSININEYINMIDTVIKKNKI